MSSTQHQPQYQDVNPAASSPRNEQRPDSASTGKNELTKEHGLLKRTVGKFKADCTCIFGGKESHYEGEATREMILGGRFLVENFMGNFDGKDFRGHKMMGFSNGEFRSTWMDNSSNDLSISKGQLVKGSDTTFDMFSEQPYRDCHGQMKTTRYRHTILSDNEDLFETFDRAVDGNKLGEEQLTMRILYRRI